jgi:catechol 2,3-dioxygenase-like lactoylglutathione lyase family enzyme
MPLEYVGIRVKDLRRAQRFYTKVMGLRVRKRGDIRKEGGGIWVGLSDPRSGHMLELNWYPPGSKFGTKFTPGESLDHIGFLLGNVSERRLVAEYERLLEAGARPTGVTPALTGGWMACVRDPEGNWVEIFRRPTPSELRPKRKKTPRTAA